MGALPKSNDDKKEKKDRSKPPVRPHAKPTDVIVQDVVDKLHPEIELLATNLKKSIQTEVRQLRAEIEMIKSNPNPKPVQPAQQAQPKVNVNEIMNDPQVQKLMNTVSGVASPSSSQVGSPTADAPNAQALQGGGAMFALEFLRMLMTNQGAFGGGNTMNEMMVRSMFAQQNRQAAVLDAVVKKVMTNVGVDENVIAEFTKTQDALLDPLAKHGAKVEAMKEAQSK